MTRLHEDELPVDLPLVRRLVDDAFPEHAGLSLRPCPQTGSSNVLVRLGTDLVVRLPRQPGGGASVVKEAAWLPYVAARLTLTVPQVVGLGEPAHGYPERWAITTWLPGHRPPAPATGRAGQALAADLARLLHELRAMPVPEDARHDPELRWYRCGPLTAVADELHEAAGACRRLGVDVDLDRALRVWEDALAAQDGRSPVEGWLHGDLVRENLLVDPDGRLAAVLDLGGLALGDTAVDLIGAWEVLDEPARARLRRELDVDDATWAVARGWVVLIALLTLPYYRVTMPDRCADRLGALRAVLAEP